jgi:hypothetical protein
VDTLERLIASLLVDITKAQDFANQYSSELVSKYRNAEKHNRNANLLVFPVPNSVIKSFEVRLTFALPEQRSTTDDAERNLTINYDCDVLKELNESVLSSITFQVEMRNYELGYKERVQAGEAGTDTYIIPR